MPQETASAGIGPALAALAATPERIITRFRRGRLRLLPTIIFVAVLMIGVRFGDLWMAVTQRADLAVVQPTLAEATGEEQPEVESVLPEEAQAPLAGEEAEIAGAEAPPVEAAPPSSGRFDISQLTESEIAVLHNLSERRDQLDAREAELEQRTAMLIVAEQRVDEKLDELNALRAHIEELLGQLSEARDGQLDSLVGIYAAMRPSDAAAIFNGLEMEVIISVFERMAERKSAPILAAMAPERAREVTAELALRQGLDLEIPQLD
ncbi:MAG: hypothetical protein H6842_13780 [Rhodospirillaceae bacterium]|nr:hypothetical protein [Rhodospirillaceae bacterium]